MTISVDRIYCVSLAHRTDRRENIQRQVNTAQKRGVLAEGLGIEFVSEPRATRSIAGQWLIGSAMTPPSWPHTAGYYAAGESHRDIYRRLWNDAGWSAALILEDDAEFTGHFYAGFSEFLKEISEDFPDWLALWLGGWNRNAPKRVGQLVNLQRGCTQMHAYVVNRHGLLRLWDHVWVEQFAVIDHSMASMMGNDECVYSPTEWHAVQGGYGSDTLRCV